MKCPHCTIEIHEGFHEEQIANTVGQIHGKVMNWTTSYMTCPACFGAIIRLHASVYQVGIVVDQFTAFPRGSGRLPVLNEVPPAIAEDFCEAANVLEISPKASAALSRRCLQATLHDKGFTQHNLVNAIEEVLKTNQLPSDLASNLDAVRVIGNFAAHTAKDKNTGEIVPVEPEEAEWNLEVLEQLFDVFYVQPAVAKKRRDDLNAKLVAAGRKPLD